MRDNYIGIIADDVPDLLVGILAVLKSGNAFVPINPVFPDERIRFIVNDCCIKVLLTDNANREKASRLARQNPSITHVFCIDDTAPGINPAPSSTPGQKNDFCYVIYTSGSTGRPKGVPITHRNLLPLFYWFKEYFQLGSDTRILQNLSYTFDFGVFEILTTLLFGGRIYIVDKTDFSQYPSFIDKYRVQTLHTTPVFFNTIAERPMPTLELLHLGGERLTGKTAARAAAVMSPRGRIYNGYGPTEATINCAIFALPGQEGESDNIPIGRPSAFNELSILDRYGNPQPVGVPGELYVSGPGLAPGYLNRPELTAEKFCPMVAESKIYKTGDLCRWLPQGNIQFLGRIDHQVKVRGFRIELGEIESRLLKHPRIKEAVVIAKEHPSGSNYLCAYFAAQTPGTFTVSQLREFLLKELPGYMVPAFFIQLEKIPLTPNGKTDLKALPRPDQTAVETGVEYTAPQTHTEEKLAAIWRQLLRREQIGTTDDFFELGGDSILVNRCIALIREELRVEIPLRKFFERPFIRAIAEEIEKQDRQVFSITPAAREGEIPLSFAQERLWFLQYLDSENPAYFVPRVIRMTGKLDVSIVERTFTEIIRRHEILRTLFPTAAGRPVQRIRPPYYFHIPLLDWKGKDEETQKRDIAAFLDEEGGKAFDFENGPLLRVTLLQLKPEEHLMVLTEHHLIHDGWTQGVLLKEFIAVFTAYTEGREHTLPDLPIQYADFAIWQRQLLKGAVLERHLDYWKKKLLPPAPVLEIPCDRPRPTVISGRGDLNLQFLSPGFSRRLIEFSRGRGVTLFMTMAAVFKTLLFRYTGVEDLCVGTGIANRRYREMEGMLGMIINTLVLRTDLSGDIDFKECMNRVKETCLEAYQHEDTPFGKVVEMLNPERNLSYTPVFQVIFSFMDTPTENLELPGLHLQLEHFHNRSSKFDINVVVVPPREEDGEIFIEWEYNTDILDETTIQRMMSHYHRLLEECTRTPGTSLARLPLLSEEETRRLLETFNDTGTDYPKEKTVHRLFEEQTLQTPDHIAVVGVSAPADPSVIQLTYRELDQRAAALGRRLKAEGVGPGSIVAIRTARSVEMMIALPGTLKAGGAYMPIPLDYPRERIDYMLADSSCKILITTTPQWDTETPKKWNGKTIRPLQPLQPLQAAAPQSSSEPAYIIYTSGSTGKPKGVIVEHRNVARLVKNTNLIEIPGDARLLATGPIGFDISVFETWYPLLNGIRLHLTENSGFLDVQKLEGNLVRHKINILHLVSQLFSSISSISPAVFGHITYLLVGGDVVRPKHVDEIRERHQELKILHMYGPTENTVFSTFFPVLEKLNESIPIGKPFANSSVYIFNKYRKPVPIGVVGELWAGGGGLARGYLNRVELTDEKFDYSSEVPGERLYNTGDLARWLPDGNIEFLGRMDNQVKILGFRVELGELENLLLRMEGIKDAAAAAYEADHEDHEKNTYLCAYIVPSSGKLDEKALREELEARLPHYMVPAHVVQLETIPLTANGKINRSALPKPELKAEPGIVAPQDEFQKKLAALWAGVLGIDIDIIGIDLNFFHLGGHSLKAALLAAAVNKEFHVRIPLAEIFQSPTIRRMAAFIKDADVYRHRAIQPAEEKEHYPLSPAQGRLYIVEQMGEGPTNYNMAVTLLLDGELRRDKLEHVFQQLTARHESLRTSFHIIGTQPVQKIHRHLNFTLQYEEAEKTDEDIDVLIRRTAAQMNRPFDLSRAPLLTARLVKVTGTRHILSFNMHHIVTDGTSLQLMIKEMLALYTGENPPPPPLQYKDYSQWRDRMILSGEIDKQEAFWLDLYRGDIPQLELPMDFPRPRVKKLVGAAVSFILDQEETTVLNRLARVEEATLYMVLLAVYNVFLSKLCHMEDILVGTSSAGRRAAGLETVVGMFINTLCLRNRPTADLPFNRFLRDLKKRSVDAFENQDYQFEDLVEKLTVKHIPGLNPLFNVNFSFHNEIEDTGTGEIQIPGLRLTPYNPDAVPAKFDLTLQGVEKEGMLYLTFQYDTALFKKKSIETFVEKFKRVVSSVIRDPHRLIGDIKIISDTQEQEMLSHAFDDLEDE